MSANPFFKIGLEIHVQLKSVEKVFSSSLNTNQVGVNNYINNLDVGEPGSLPHVNPEVILLARRVASVFKCKHVDKNISFLRKTYFYSDLPKGFQLTQLDNSIGLEGSMCIPIFNSKKQWCSNKLIVIDRVQIEEDTATKRYLNHELQLNFNRSGIPLVEIVTAPSFTDSGDVITFLKILRFFLIKMGISRSRYEKGEIRCDVNISINTDKFAGPRIEIKNLNSYSNIRKAITQEKALLGQSFIKNEQIISTTKKFNEQTQQLVVMRAKMSESSYLFSREPNLPIIQLTSLPLEEQQMDTVLTNTIQIYQQLLNPMLFYDHYAVIFESGDLTIVNLLLAQPIVINNDFIHFIFKWIIKQKGYEIVAKTKILILYDWFRQNYHNNISALLLNELIGKFMKQAIDMTEFCQQIIKYTKNFLNDEQIEDKIKTIISNIKESVVRKSDEKILSIIFGLFMKQNSSQVSNSCKIKERIFLLWHQKNSDKVSS